MQKWAILFVVFGYCFTARAFHIGDHKTIMREAFSELAKCYPSTPTLLSVEWLVSGDVDEDLDLVTKWLYYSHYYNPNKKLDMLRADSSARIADLAPELRHASSGKPVDSLEASELGHMIHHFQDMAVPAHVVPITHSLWDGFESYDFEGDISSGWSCDQIAALSDSDPEVILKETAESTLSAIQDLQVDFVSSSTGLVNHVVASGSAFWQESKDDSFGQYGYLGNNFGQTDFTVNDTEYKLPEDFAPHFKQQQMRLAVRATLRGLMWEMGPDLNRNKFRSEPVISANAD